MLLLLFGVFVLSFLLTNEIRKLAIRHQLLDHPNHRSAHSSPTPRGGGLAIVIGVFVGLFALYINQKLSLQEFLTFLIAGFLVGLSGFLDDKFSLSPAMRMAFQLIAVLVGIYGLGAITTVSLGFIVVNHAYWLIAFSILYLLWLTNLYNFMDGINGIASLQAISVGVGMAYVYYLEKGAIDYLSLVVAAASVGFLYWNFPKAKIFMGDVGSGFLGLVFGLISIKYVREFPQILFCFLILMGVFIVDATFTLVRRFVRGKKIHQAHSSHAYQHAARQRKSHTQVSLGILMINVLWLFPLAVLVTNKYLSPVAGLLIAYTPLVVVIFRLKAGLDEPQFTDSRI